MIVDPDEASRTRMKHLFRAHDYRVADLQDARNASVPDAIIVDLEGCGAHSDPTSLIEQFRTRNPHLRIIALSPTEDASHRDMADSMGADCCMPKLSNPLYLLHLTDMLLNGRNTRVHTPVR
jgi:DNA-binding NarL/FixJ family response regulator